MAKGLAKERKKREDYANMAARIQELEAENEFLLKCLEVQNVQPDGADNAAEISLRKQLVALQSAYLEDVEQDIQIIGEYFALSERHSRENALAANSLQDAAEEARRWKKAYQTLADSKLGRLQRWYWRLCDRIAGKKRVGHKKAAGGGRTANGENKWILKND